MMPVQFASNPLTSLRRKRQTEAGRSKWRKALEHNQEWEGRTQLRRPKPRPPPRYKVIGVRFATGPSFQGKAESRFEPRAIRSASNLQRQRRRK
jgi:hypothetical protein